MMPLNSRAGDRSGLRLAALAALLALWFAACSSKPKEERHPLRGTIVSVQANEGFIVVDGQAIPGFMMAMKMPYQIRDASEYSKLAPGDAITADIVVSDQGDYLENIVVSKAAGGSGGEKPK